MEFKLMREGVPTIDTCWVKVYHIDNGQSVLTSSVGRNTYSTSSGAVLQAGWEDNFGVSRRGNMLTVYHILMFTTESAGIELSTWRDTQKIFIPNSI